MRVEIPVVIDEYEGDKYIEVSVVAYVYPGEAETRDTPGVAPYVEVADIYLDVAEDVLGKDVEVDLDQLFQFLADNEQLWIEKAFEYAEANTEDR